MSYSQTNFNAIIFCLLLLIPAFASAADNEKIQPTQQMSNDDCLECHGSTKHKDNNKQNKRTPYIAAETFINSVHGSDQKCLGCHTDITQEPHRKEIKREVNCTNCHKKIWQQEHEKNRIIHPRLDMVESQIADYRHSIHASPRADDPTRPKAYCYDCHDAHAATSLDDKKNRQAFRLSSPEVCGNCHEEEQQLYLNSIHGQQALQENNPDAAVCIDCHGSHKVSAVEALPTHRQVTQNCRNCHQQEVDGYIGNLHGKLAWHGDKKAPKCFTCHTTHDIQRVSDIASPMHLQNRLKNCQECHQDANAQLIKYKPHGSISNFEKYPMLWLFGKGLAISIIAILIFSYLHSMLWFFREYRERKNIAKYTGITPAKHKSGKHFQRFSLVWRINHWLLALSVMTLVLTGMTVMFPDASWASWLVSTTGGSHTFGTIHRIAGVIFLLVISGHTVAVLFKLLRQRDFQWFGPNSLILRRKDLDDLKAQFKWFFGKGKQPQFDQWTYWEKFDYWAVYWGALVIGVSGLILWNSDLVGKILPGWIFNIATIAHSLEAFLSVMVLFVVHFFNNHFRPAKFPLDIVMFTGSVDIEELKADRPEQYKRLLSLGQLESHLVPPPSARKSLLFHLIGFSLLGFGLLLLVLAINGILGYF